MRRRRSIPLVLAIAVAATVLSACAFFEPGSFGGGQPGGIGSVRLHLIVCTYGEESFDTEENGDCHVNDVSTEPNQAQLMVGFAVPTTSPAPATVTAQPLDGGPTITYTRNQEVGERMAELTFTDAEEKPLTWPPEGDEIVGYLSEVVTENPGDQFEWSIDADFGLPADAGGSFYPNQYTSGVATGWRVVNPSRSADRPINCEEVNLSGPEPEFNGTCAAGEIAPIPVSDLKVASPAPVVAYIGDKVNVPFALDFATTASSPPSFALAAGTNVANATAAPTDPNFPAPAVDPGTHRAPTATREVQVTTPKTAQPGSYEVKLTATTPGGGSTSGSGTLILQLLKVGFGKIKPNLAKGTATLTLKVPTAGTLTLAGKNVAKVKRKPKGAKTLKVTVRAKGKAKETLAADGKVKLKPKIIFKASSGASFTKVKALVLKLAG